MTRGDSHGPEVTVVGAGVVGLTVARRLREGGGARLRVVADRVASRSSSRVAGAVWFPYQVGPEGDERTQGWARETYRELVRLADLEGTGVRPALPTYFLADTEEPPAWSGALPPEVPLRWIDAAELPASLRGHLRRRPAAGAWCFPAPVLDPSAHLEWLAGCLPPGCVETATVRSLEEVPGDVVVLCAGRRSRLLTGDPKLVPALGQVALARAPGLPREYAFADDRDPEAPVYSIPRGETVVLGGCSLAGRGGEAAWTSPDAPATEAALEGAILGRFEAAGWLPGSTRGLAEWRPVREGGVRLEAVGRVLHAYGHGGAGFSLALGFAESVAAEVRRLLGGAPEES